MTVVRTLAGGLNGTFAAFADGTGSQAGFNQPYGVAVDASGNTYVIDRFNYRVRKVTPGGGASMLLCLSINIKRDCASLAMMRASGSLRVVDVLRLDWKAIPFSIAVSVEHLT